MALRWSRGGAHKDDEMGLDCLIHLGAGCASHVVTSAKNEKGGVYEELPVFASWVSGVSEGWCGLGVRKEQVKRFRGLC